MSDLGRLSQCLVDNDSDARIRARRLRSKAFVLSVVIECALVAALLVWPLISPASLSATNITIVAPPFAGGGGAPAHRPHSGTRRFDPSRPPTLCLADCAPVFRPSAPVANDSDAPDFADAPGIGSGPAGPGFGPGIPGGLGDRAIPQPPPPPAPRPVRRGGDIMAAMLVHQVDPIYPTIAKAAHISGVVHLHATISKDGTIRELELVDGSPLLAQAALAAVRQWRYRPTLLSGEPVEVDTYITVKFVLN